MYSHDRPKLRYLQSNLPLIGEIVYTLVPVVQYLGLLLGIVASMIVPKRHSTQVNAMNILNFGDDEIIYLLVAW